MVKVKNMRTAECVVGGFRYGSKATTTLGSLLLGLYDDDGLLHHVGFCSSPDRRSGDDLTPDREVKRSTRTAAVSPAKPPGGPSRWSTERSGEWESLGPELGQWKCSSTIQRRPFPPRDQVPPLAPDKPAKRDGMEQVRRRRGGGEDPRAGAQDPTGRSGAVARAARP